MSTSREQIASTGNRRRPYTVRDAFIVAASEPDPDPEYQPSPHNAAQTLSALLQALDVNKLCSNADTNELQSGRLKRASKPAEKEDRTGTTTDGPSSKKNIEAQDLRVPLQIRSGSVNRAQVRQRFLDLHFGTSNLASFVFVYEVFNNTDDKGHIATTAAVDTMCIAQIATSFHDSRLMQTARVMYSRVAQAISRRLRRLADGSLSGVLDDIFGGIHALITCAFFSGLKIDAKDRVAHVQGLENITRSISSDTISPKMREAFKCKWGRQGFWLAIKQRKDLSRVDSGTNFADCWRITDSEALSWLASQVPGLLERSDNCFFKRSRHSRLSQKDLFDFLNELETTVAGLKKWQLRWESAIPSPYQLKGIRSFEAFRGISGRYFEVFKTAYSFSSPADERDFRVLQICLMSLDLTIIQLHRNFARYLIDEEVQIQLRRAKFGAGLAAEALCMMVPWTSRPQIMAFAGVYTQPLLERAMPYFQEHGNREQVEWCKTVSRSLNDIHGVNFFVGQG